jgi:hypothetical protein
MAVYDLGDVVSLGITITNSAGTAENATSVVATITLPDGTTTTPSVTNSGAGLYDISYTPAQVGRYGLRWVATGTNASAYADEFTVRDYADLGITSLDEVKAHINYNSTSTADDEELRRIIDAATDLCEQYVGQVLGRRTFTSELYDGNTEALRLRSPKAISITSVYENGALLPAAAYALDPTGQRLFRVGSGTLYATNSYGYWTGGMQNISVTYVAGWVNPPASAKQGVLETIRHLWQTQRGSMSVGGGRGVQGDETYTTPSYSLPRRVMELLDPISLPGVA